MKPHIYVMPEEFMADQSVPAHWRLLGVLNGFFFNHKDIYASNEWFQKQLRCSRPTISAAVAHLEELGLIEVIRTKTTRIIKHKGVSSFTTPRKPTAISEESSFTPNSVSNAVSINTAQSAEPIREEKDEPTRSKAVLGAKQIYEPLVKWAEEERGAPFLATHRLSQYKALKVARENGIKSSDLKERWQEMASDKFWASNGFDWLHVVNSFNRKPV